MGDGSAIHTASFLLDGGRENGNRTNFFELFHLFDDEHFDWLVAGNEFQAKLIIQSFFK